MIRLNILHVTEYQKIFENRYHTFAIKLSNNPPYDQLNMVCENLGVDIDKYCFALRRSSYTDDKGVLVYDILLDKKTNIITLQVKYEEKVINMICIKKNFSISDQLPIICEELKLDKHKYWLHIDNSATPYYKYDNKSFYYAHLKKKTLSDTLNIWSVIEPHHFLMLKIGINDKPFDKLEWICKFYDLIEDNYCFSNYEEPFCNVRDGSCGFHTTLRRKIDMSKVSVMNAKKKSEIICTMYIIPGKKLQEIVNELLDEICILYDFEKNAYTLISYSKHILSHNNNTFSYIMHLDKHRPLL